ncbi:MAG TPA: hypothetical protein VFG21_03820 [Xanthomonadaceae bacterium]|nr:hypothetical protein [Xanthomonadaceae bacterium]
MQARIELGAATELWQRLVRGGAERTGMRLEEDVEAYLVFVLMRYLRDDTLLARAMALDYLAANQAAGQPRMDALRDVGDRCLLIAGLFPQQAQRRQVDPDYFSSLGRGAYETVASLARSAYAQLFAELTRGFGAMVQVLAASAAAGHPELRATDLLDRIVPASPARRH